VKWNDGQFCDVSDPWTDHLVMADSDEVDNRFKCFEFCSVNRIKEKGTCCGLIFENTVESGETKISCGLFFADMVEKPVNEFEGGFYYYTAIELGDGLRAKYEDI
jgi:hypothetical protein